MMQAGLRQFLRILWMCAVLIGACDLRATSVPRLTLQQLASQSELIVMGKVVRSWPAWDRSHRFIWTHYELAVRDVSNAKAATRTLTVSEPGGEVDGIAMSMQGAVRFTPGEETLLFLYKTPIGYLRTVGYGQGKYLVGPDQRLHADLGPIDLVDMRQAAARIGGTPLSSLEGCRVNDLRTRLANLRAERRTAAR